MKQSFLAKIKRILISQREEILSQQSNAPLDIDISGDEVDEIQGKILANVQAQLTSRAQNKLKGIDTTLGKIAEGTFGHCEECGEVIAEKRLLINPMFLTCISCAEQLEMEEKRKRI